MDELDRILSSEEPLIASSGFAGRVMDAVRESSETPLPLPFPWWRFSGGIAACLACTGSATLLVPRLQASLPAEASAQLSAVAPELGYAAALLVATLAAFGVQRTLADSRMFDDA